MSSNPPSAGAVAVLQWIGPDFACEAAGRTSAARQTSSAARRGRIWSVSAPYCAALIARAGADGGHVPDSVRAPHVLWETSELSGILYE